MVVAVFFGARWLAQRRGITSGEDAKRAVGQGSYVPYNGTISFTNVYMHTRGPGSESAAN